MTEANCHFFHNFPKGAKPEPKPATAWLGLSSTPRRRGCTIWLAA